MHATCRVLIFAAALVASLGSASLGGTTDANRLAYLDGPADPYYPHRAFARLTTPQWVGEAGVDAVVILSIDDLRDTTPQPLSVGRYEAFLRPIINCLKQLDPDAGLSIMTCQVDPKGDLLQAWLKQGVSLDVHTIDHPCPLLHGGDFAKAKSTYDRCVDLMASIPGNTPVAFRMPCCDSKNTPSPRFFAEIFNKTTPGGRFLSIDSSVFNITTSKDPALPKELTTDADGKERFRKYVPFPSYANTIEDYPYPYVIGGLCWELPCATPSDWQGQHLLGPNSPKMLEDWKAQLDVTVIKQGVMPIVFHPHGWSTPEQFVELIDYAQKKYGRRVKFLSFAQAGERLRVNLLAGNPLRDASGIDNGVRVLDVNADGYMDAVIGNDRVQVTRVWDPTTAVWKESPFPARATDARFGARADGVASMVADGLWHFGSGGWRQDAIGLPPGEPGFRPRDINGDKECELISDSGRVYARPAGRWERLPFALPAQTPVVGAAGKDAGLRWVDIDDDGDLDLIVSNEQRYGVYRFTGMTTGWSDVVRAGERGKGRPEDEIPPIVVQGKDNGAWFHSRAMWVQNENTAGLPDHVARVSFEQLNKPAEPQPPLSPEQALKTFKIYPGFTIDLAVAEPLVMDPVAFNWGSDGKLWVVEMGDYPLGVDGKGSPGGVVRFLEDADGDGKYDKSTVFLDKLPFPTGVTPWRKGVLVTCAPDIFYAEDTDGDGRADRREVLFTGFAEGNQQHRVNGLVYGLDNWFYGANGDSGGTIKSTRTGKQVDIRGRDFRINPDTGEIDTVTGQAQFGRTRDDWGNWFGCNNSNPAFQYVLDDRYLRHNPHVAAPNPKHDVPETPGAAPVFPISKTEERFNNPRSANHFTSACGLIFYRDELFGSGYRNNTFVSEPVHNLVHREIAWQDGVLVKSRRADDEHRMEFIASSDNWFRPTMLRVGPDGALWIADMYRAVIEHPQWIPKETQAKLDLRAGHDKGRLYRVYPPAKQLRAIPNLAKLDAAGLVKSLESAGGWERDMAQQLLLERQEKAAVPHLEKLAAASPRALARLHALCTLGGLDALQPAVLTRAMQDQIPGVRAHAVRLAEQRLGNSPELAEAVLKLARDPDATVRMQVAYSLGEWDDPRAGEALAAIAVRDARDPYLTAAVMSSVTGKNLAAVIAGVTKNPKRSPPAGVVSNLVRMAAATGNDAAAAAALMAVVQAPDRSDAELARKFNLLAAAFDGLEQGGMPLAGFVEAKAKLEALISAARNAIITEEQSPDLRAAAAAVLGWGPPDEQALDADLLSVAFAPQTPERVQSAAVARLARIRHAKAADALLGSWAGMTPALRVQTLDAVLRRADLVPKLLAAVESRKILAADIDAPRRRQLHEHADEAIRRRAQRTFAAAINPDRQKVIDEFQAALTLEGDPARGKEFFKSACATCHKVGDVGVNVGPDLLSLADHSPEYYLLHVLDPNRAVEARYTNYLVETKKGQTYSGILSGETGNSVTLLGAGGQPQTILRSDLKRLRATPLSAMPEGFEIGRTPQDLADLIAFLAANGPPPQRKTFSGNNPQTVKVAAGGQTPGVLRLLPSSAEIYGPTLVLEPKYENLGYWSSAEDRAVWSVESPRPRAFDVFFDYACDAAAAGNGFVLSAGTVRLTGKVASTGTWDEYRRVKMGRIELPAGVSRVVLRSDGPVKSAMIDLRAIELVPATD